MGCIGQLPTAGAWSRAERIQLPRGPDEQGRAEGTLGGIPFAVAHQRLSIIDLTPTGAQPMVHPQTGSFLVFNGEIYNYIEIRDQLRGRGIVFRGTSDTEVLLHALETWGIDEALQKLNGAWAFAWVRPKFGTAYLSRDRFGEKPLHFCAGERSLVWGSDLRAVAILAERGFRVDDKSLARFLRLGALEVDRRTLLDGIFLVEPATYMELEARGGMLRAAAPVRYWDCPTRTISAVSGGDFIDALRATVIDSVRIRLRSDVPVGILLSGGLDSSVMAACAAQVGQPGLALLSMVDEDSGSGDTPFVEAMERHLGMRVTRVRLPEASEAAFDALADTVRGMGLPLNSFAMVAHGMLMREARARGIKVVLSGQGADEALCGYRKYLGFAVIEQIRRGRLAQAGGLLAGFVANRSIIPQFSFGEGMRYLPRRLGGRSRLGERLRSIDVEAAGLEPGETIAERQRRDIIALSVPTLNAIEDRSSMAHSCEIRLPYLDHRVIELAVPAPLGCKLARGWTKVALRDAFKDLLPPAVVWRRDKQGFANPEARLLRTSMKDRFVREFLDPHCRVYRDGFLDHGYVAASFERFCGGPRIARPWVRDFIQVMTLELWLADNDAAWSGWPTAGPH